MPASDTFTFTGQARTGWYAYRDLATGRMLEAEPGGTYQIQALEPGLPVPPPGGQWVPATASAAKATAKASTSDAAPASAPGGDV